MRRVLTMGVNMQIVDEVRKLVHQVERGQVDRTGTRETLLRLSNLKSQYSRWTVIVMVGLGCAAFSRLFGGDWPVFLVTFFAAGIAQFVRQELQRRHFNSLIVVVVTLLSLATVIEEWRSAQQALAARLYFETLLSRVSTAFVELPSNRMETTFATWAVW